MGLLASLLGGVIGGAAEPLAAGLGAMKPLFEDAAEEARWHARAYLAGPPGNHDLERALHAAAVTGVLAVLRGHEMAALGERAPRPGSLRDRYRRLLTGLETVLDLGVPDPGALEVWHTRDWCHKELGRLRELEEEDHQRVLATLDAALVPGFAAPGAPRAESPPDGRIRAAEDAVFDRLRAGLAERGVRLTEGFEARFRSRDPKAPGWFGCFMAYLQDALKKDGKAQRSFLPKQLAKLREAQGATAELVQRLLQGQAQQLDRLETAQERESRLSAERHAEVMAVLNRDKGVPHATLRALLVRMGEEGVAEEAVEARLTAKAEEYRTLRDELARRTNDRPDAAAARDRALRRLDAGDFAGARAVLAEGRGRLRELREQTAREESVLAAEEARVARLELRYREAAELYAEAAALVPFDVAAAWRHTIDAAFALYAQGNEFGDNDALRQAIARYGEALVMAPRQDRPDDWALTQNSLGNALQKLGERESGTARLEQAVAAYQSALEEMTRERLPLNWATTQNNLGNALQALGERESGTARLEQAVAAYRAALEERTRERVPLNWAMTQNNLGNALAVLGERESGTARLEEAVAAHQAALEERTRQRVPFLHAQTTENLALDEEALGDRTSDAARWGAALLRAEAVLEEYTRAGAEYDIGRATALRDGLAAKLAALS